MNHVNKVWGSEDWIINRNYCGKILNLNKGCQCSLHFHKNKDETFFILNGKVLMELNSSKRIMKKGDIQIIEAGQKHRFVGLKNSQIIEFSTHHEESDSYRDEESKKLSDEEFSKLLKTLKEK